MRQKIFEWWDDKTLLQRILGIVFLLIIAAIIVLIIYFFAWLSAPASAADVTGLIPWAHLTLR